MFKSYSIGKFKSWGNPSADSNDLNNLPLSVPFFNTPNILLSIKHLRQNQPHGIGYILHCLKENPNCHITAEKLSCAINITHRAAHKMLYRFRTLGYGRIEIKTIHRKDTTDPKSTWRYAWANGQTYFQVIRFFPIIDAFKSLFGNFLKNHCSSIVLNNNKYILNSTDQLILAARRPGLSSEKKRQIILGFMKLGRKDLWNYFTDWWYKQEKEPEIRKYCKDTDLSQSKTDEVLARMFGAVHEPEDASHTESVLEFFVSPKLVQAAEDLEYVCDTMDDLDSQRDVWTDKQRRFWFGLKSKYTKLCKYIKELLSSVVRYEDFIKI